MIHSITILLPENIYWCAMDLSKLIEKLFGINPRNGNTIFHDIAQDGSLMVLERIEYVFDEQWKNILKTINYDGDSCVHIAASRSKGIKTIRLLELLVELGVDLSVQNTATGCTVLHIATWRKNYRLAKWLCQQPNFQINAKHWDGLTAFQLAFVREDKKMMQILRTCGAVCETPKKSYDESDAETSSNT